MITEFFSFEMCHDPHDDYAHWQTSSRQFSTAGLALEAATNWLEVCAENDFFPAVRVVRLPRLEPES